MYKFQTISVAKRGFGNKCSVCHTSKISFIFTPPTEDAFFLLNKLFEIPTEDCAKSLNQQAFLAAGLPAEDQLATGLQLQLCSSCEVEIERAKRIYQELVVAVGQFRDIQRKLAISIKTSQQKVHSRDETESGNVEDDRCWSLLGTDVTNSSAKFFHVEESAPFLVENLLDKLELVTTATCSTAQSIQLEVANEKQKTETVSAVCNESVSKTEGNSDDENEKIRAVLPESIDKQSLQDSINSPITVKEEYDAWIDDDVCIDDEEEVKITAEEHFGNTTSPPAKLDNVESMTDSDDPTYTNNSKKPSFQCKQCDLHCSSKRGLSMHMSRKHGVCVAQRKRNQRSKKRKKAALVTSKQGKRIHGTCPPKGGKYKCLEEGCGKSFLRPHMLNIHLSRHAKQPMFKCQLCEKASYTKLGLRKHIRRVHPEVSIPKEPKRTVNFGSKIESYECNICSKVFKSNAGVSNHKKVHGIVEELKQRVCPEEGCDQIFKSRNCLTQLREHLSRCHGWEPSYKCSKCDRAFITWKQKWRHEQEVHADGLTTRPFICDFCGKGFSCAEYLHAHRHVNHKKTTVEKNKKTGISQRCICELCGLSYSCVNSLKTHIHLQHPDGPPVSCDVCGKTFKTQTALNTHTLSIHNQDKLKAACHFCEKRFLGPQGLAKHMLYHHSRKPRKCSKEDLKNENFQEKFQEKFQCPITGCRRIFYKVKERLDNHMLKIHGADGKKPGALKCKYCGQSYFLGFKLRHHELTHENKETRPYICDICQKGFPTAYHLQFHKVHTHKLTGVKLEHGAKRQSSVTTEGC